MSTRSNIKVFDELGSILLYKHHDGYPDGGPGMINFLTNFIKQSKGSADVMANLMLERTEVEASTALHGDIEFYYEVDVPAAKVTVYEVDMLDMSQTFLTSVVVIEKGVAN